jgi:hypothetical protein
MSKISKWPRKYEKISKNIQWPKYNGVIEAEEEMKISREEKSIEANDGESWRMYEIKQSII